MSISVTDEFDRSGEGEEDEYEYTFEDGEEGDEEGELDYEEGDENEDEDEDEEENEFEYVTDSTQEKMSVKDDESSSQSSSNYKHKKKGSKGSSFHYKRAMDSSSGEYDSSKAFDEKFYTPRHDRDSSGGNYFSVDDNTRDDLENFFGVEKGRKKKRDVNWENSESIEPMETVEFNTVNNFGGDTYVKGQSKKEQRKMLEEKRKYLQSRIRNLERLLEKGALDSAVEAVEMKKIRYLKERLRQLDSMFDDRRVDYEEQHEDFKHKLQLIRKIKSKHQKIMHSLRTLKYDRETKGVSNDKQRNTLNKKRVYLERKINDLGGLISEDSDYSVGSWDSVEEDRGKDGTYFLVVDRPSGLDIPKEKERNGAVFFDPNEGDPTIRKFKGIKDLHGEIEEILKEARKLEKIRKNNKLTKTEELQLLDRIQTLLMRADKLKQLSNANIKPENVSKHKRLGQLYLKYFDLSDQLMEAKNDEDVDASFVKKLLKSKKQLRGAIEALEKELQSSIQNPEEEDSTAEEIEEKWKLVDDAKEKFSRAPKNYKDPFTVNEMLGEAKKLEIKAEQLWYEQPHTRENRYRVRKNIGKILNIFDDLNSLNHPHRGRSQQQMRQPNIDIRNMYPLDGKNRSRGRDSDSAFGGEGHRLGNGNDERGNRRERGKNKYPPGFPQIYDRNLREAHYLYPPSKLLHYGPLTNSNGHKEHVFLFEDRMICTRINKTKADRFHFKNEILLSTGELKIKKKALEMDTHSFLNENYKKPQPKKDPWGIEERKKEKEKEVEKKVQIKLSPEEKKKNEQFEEEMLEMEDESHKPKGHKKHRKDLSTFDDSTHYEPSVTKEKMYSVSVRRQDEQEEGNSGEAKKTKDDYHCFLVGNGRKGKFFYASSRSEMNKWCKMLKSVQEKHNPSPLSLESLK